MRRTFSAWIIVFFAMVSQVSAGVVEDAKGTPVKDLFRFFHQNRVGDSFKTYDRDCLNAAMATLDARRLATAHYYSAVQEVGRLERLIAEHETKPGDWTLSIKRFKKKKAAQEAIVTASEAEAIAKYKEHKKVIQCLPADLNKFNETLFVRLGRALTNNVLSVNERAPVDSIPEGTFSYLAGKEKWLSPYVLRQAGGRLSWSCAVAMESSSLSTEIFGVALRKALQSGGPASQVAAERIQPVSDLFADDSSARSCRSEPYGLLGNERAFLAEEFVNWLAEGLRPVVLAGEEVFARLAAAHEEKRLAILQREKQAREAAEARKREQTAIAEGIRSGTRKPASFDEVLMAYGKRGLDADLFIKPADLDPREGVFLFGTYDSVGSRKFYGRFDYRGDVFYFAAAVDLDTTFFNKDRGIEGGPIRVFGKFVGPESYRTRSGRARVMPVVKADYIDFRR